MATTMEAGMFIILNIHACVCTHVYAHMHVCAHMCGGAPTQHHQTSPSPPTRRTPFKSVKIALVKGWSGLSKMSKCPSTQPPIGGSDSTKSSKTIELSQLGCDLFDY